ncbi:hypothetical protein L208DRAFT_1376232 [Tricholoma matsutake]|nr:hypothetical protein L208DRAFT_1376232 [Tricholoma matsutake 945]
MTRKKAMTHPSTNTLAPSREIWADATSETGRENDSKWRRENDNQGGTASTAEEDTHIGKGGRSTSRNGANISAGEADPGERGEAAGRALVGTGEVSRATTTTGDREIGSYHQRGGTTTGEEDINDDGEPPPERGPLSARTGHHHLRETATGEDGPPMRRDHQWRGASMTAVEQQ